MNQLFNRPMPPRTTFQNNQQNPFAFFANNFSRRFPNMDPKSIATQLINSGAMSQEQFQYFSQIANRLTGRG